MSRVMCALLWEAPGRADELARMAEKMLAQLEQVGAVPIQRWLRDDPLADADPAEMHLVEWPEGTDYDRWRFSEAAQALVAEHREDLASWQTFWMRPA